MKWCMCIEYIFFVSSCFLLFTFACNSLFRNFFVPFTIDIFAGEDQVSIVAMLLHQNAITSSLYCKNSLFNLPTSQVVKHLAVQT